MYIFQGSVFTVYLPAIARQYDLETEQIKEKPRGKEHILFVDDEPAIADVAGKMLMRLGYQVTTKTDSLEALAFFRSNPDAIDLVITDLSMPKMEGMKLAGELIKIKSDIPIVLMSGYNRQVSEDEAAAMGIKVFIDKPIIFDHLAKILRDILDTKKQKP